MVLVGAVLCFAGMGQRGNLSFAQSPDGMIFSNGFEYSGFSVSMSATDAVCEGSGTATATVSGGAQPFTLSWDHTGETDTTISGLIPGIYSVTVTDNDGASIHNSVEVTSSCSSYCNSGFTVSTTIDSECGISCSVDSDCNGLVADRCVNGTCGNLLEGSTGAFLLNTDSGKEYTVSTCFPPPGGTYNIDTQLTMLNGEGGFVLFNDDMGYACNIGGGPADYVLSELHFVAPGTETYQIEVSRYFCTGSWGSDGVTVGISCQ